MTDSSLTPWPWPTPEPGIYFEMPFDEYLAIPAINFSSIKKLLISITDFYNVAWFNPLRDETDVDVDTRAKQEGRAYHKRVLEGRKAFYSEYAPDYEDMGQEDILRTGDDIRAALGRIGKPISFKNKPEGIKRLLEANPAAKILDVLVESHRSKYPGREYLDPKLVRKIELCAAMIEHHPDLRGWLAGGHPEVTVIWDDPWGVRCKIRIDYLKIACGLDLKTFANIMQRDLAVAVRKTIFGRRYDLQAWHYIRGIAAARKMAADGKVFGPQDAGLKKWMQAFAAGQTEEYRFIFAQKESPVVRGRWFSVNDPKFNEKGEYIKKAISDFKQAYETFGEGPWIDTEAPEMLTFDEVY